MHTALLTAPVGLHLAEGEPRPDEHPARREAMR
jgi:hypothetical protein